MSDAYYPEFDPGIMQEAPRFRYGPVSPVSPRVLTTAESFAYRARCAADGIEFTDADGNHVLDGTHGNAVEHACRGSWTLAGQNAAGHDVFTCDARGHRYVAQHHSADHKCLSVLDCASGTVATPAEVR